MAAECSVLALHDTLLDHRTVWGIAALLAGGGIGVGVVCFLGVRMARRLPIHRGHS
jgi:hypothetical protein